MSNEHSTVQQARHDGYCPACGYQTLEDGTTGSFAICPICRWEDEHYPLSEPETVTGGPNDSLSLASARQNVRDHGDIYHEESEHSRQPRADESRHPEWPFTR